jgi:hypothetical protein
MNLQPSGYELDDLFIREMVFFTLNLHLPAFDLFLEFKHFTNFIKISGEK